MKVEGAKEAEDRNEGAPLAQEQRGSGGRQAEEALLLGCRALGGNSGCRRAGWKRIFRNSQMPEVEKAVVNVGGDPIAHPSPPAPSRTGESGLRSFLPALES